ncbi:PH domain-containing protein [Legionella bononiensis]|uniref:PH domain-containing protein n=1 Tax=Legionella bononiensis TaxID=2793102 RepID=A0ABS1WA26_9GAMM|nr:PH domain-containing protein [Legionella bononiensis]MBL7480544.1 PH domain-containing protein [Legionella bononiensis]MBL7526217.1 PH domain-containing protein [Legionella bononiensis]MBL7563288.1 PH domain-containing protein [Legionella bononiensis]
MAETNTESNVIYFTRLHWVIFFGPILGLGIAIALYVYIVQLRQVSLILVVFALIWILMTWVTFYFSSITIKRKQVILRTGIIVRQTVDIPLSKIETIDIRQSILGSILRYGSLVITGTGGTRHLINFLHHPLTCRRYIEQLMNEPQ